MKIKDTPPPTLIVKPFFSVGMIVCLAAIVIQFGIFGFFFIFGGNNSVAGFGARIIPITPDANLTLSVKDCSIGDITIEGTDDVNHISIISWKTSKNDKMAYEYDQMNKVFEIDGCDLRLAVPHSINLHLNASNIYISGVQGQIDMHINGGNMILNNCQAKGNSSIEGNGSYLYFKGSFAAESNTNISFNSGEINLSLPKDSAFQLETSGILGPIISTFPLQTPDGYSGFKTTIGSNPTSKLKMQVNSTTLILRAID